MKKTHKLLTFTTSLLLLAGIVACGGPSSSGGSTTSSATTSEATSSVESATSSVTSSDSSQTTTSVVDWDAELASAKAYLFQLYRSLGTIQGDTDLVRKVAIGDYSFDVAWSIVDLVGRAETVALVEKDATTMTLTVDAENNFEETTFALNAVISYGEHSTTQKFGNLKVEAYKVLTLSEYLAVPADESVRVKGVVSYANWDSGYSNGSVWIQDDEGGYYGYRVTADSGDQFYADFTPGNEVIFEGTQAIYQGLYEIKDVSYRVISTGNTVPGYTDVTSAFAAAENESDAKSLNVYQNMKVTLTDVEVAGVTANDKGDYYNFKIGNSTMYMRASTTFLTDEEYNTMFEEWTAGYKATVTGIVQVYGSKFYIQPIEADAVTITSKEASADVKVATTLEEVSSLFEETYVEAASIDLPTVGTSFNDVELTYALADDSDTTYFALSDGKLNITVPTEGEAVGKLVVTATKGSVTDSVTVTITASANYEITTIADFIANKDTANTANIQGVVTAVASASAATEAASTSFVITDETGSIFAYNKASVKLGDEVIIRGVYAENYSFPQLGSPEVLKIVSTGNDLVSSSGLASVYTAADVVTDLANLDSAGLISKYAGNYSVFTGYLVKDGNFYELAANSTDTSGVISLYSYEDLSAYVGQEVTVIGFARGTNKNSGYISVQTQFVRVAPKAETAYNIALHQANLEKDLYFAGEMSGYYYATTETAADATKVYLEETTGGYYMYFLDGETKTYLNYILNGSYKNIVLETTASSVWAYNPFYDTMTTVLSEEVYYLGTYDTYNTISASKISYAATSFVSHLVAPVAAEEDSNNLFTATKWLEGDEMLADTEEGASLVYWADTDWSGSHVDATATVENDVFTIESSLATGSNWFGLQVFANVEGNAAGDKYDVSFTLTSSVAGQITVNGQVVDIVVGDNEITSTKTINNATRWDGAAYIESPLSIQFGVSGADATANDAMLTATYSFKNVVIAEAEKTVYDTHNTLATFEFGTDDATKTDEGSQDGSSITEYTETVGDYTLTLSDLAKVYSGSYDAKGNACLKLGTGSAAASFTFTVGDDVDSVVIRVAGYKARTAAITINGGTEQIISTQSANGEYTDVVIDTTTTKTITFATTSNGYRCKITSIAYLAAK